MHCRPFTNAMAAQLVKALGASLTSISQANITVNNAIQVPLPACLHASIWADTQLAKEERQHI